MRLGLALFVLSGVALAAGHAIAAEPPTISKNELRSNPPAQTHRQLRDVVWGMFSQEDYRREATPARPLSHVGLQTGIEPTDVPGLCRYDAVDVEFAKVDPRADGADAPVRAVGLSSRHMFTFAEPPKANYETIVDHSHRQTSKPCSRLSRDVRAFEAPDEEAATRAYRALMALLGAVRAGKPVPLQCTLHPTEKRTCEALVAAFKIEDLDSVDPCDANPAQRCQKLYMGDRLLTITTTGMVSPGPPPGEIVSVTLDSLIVLIHPVID